MTRPDLQPTAEQSREDVGSCLLALALIPVVFGWCGYVLMTVWNWFVVPLGVTPLTFWWACGIASVMSAMRRRYHSDDDKTTAAVRFGQILFSTTLLFAIAYLEHWMMMR